MNGMIEERHGHVESVDKRLSQTNNTRIGMY